MVRPQTLQSEVNSGQVHDPNIFGFVFSGTYDGKLRVLEGIFNGGQKKSEIGCHSVCFSPHRTAFDFGAISPELIAAP